MQCSVLRYVAVSVLHRVVVSVLQYVAVCCSCELERSSDTSSCSVLQCVEVCCSQCIVVCCSHCVAGCSHCVAVRCSVLQVRIGEVERHWCLQCVAECCRVSQSAAVCCKCKCVAVRCSQCVAVRCIVLQVQVFCSVLLSACCSTLQCVAGASWRGRTTLMPVVCWSVLQWMCCSRLVAVFMHEKTSSHVTHVHESCHTYKWATSHI